MFYVLGSGLSQNIRDIFNAKAKADGLNDVAASIATFPGTEPFSELMFDMDDAAVEQFKKDIKDQPVAIIQSTAAPVSENVMQTLLTARTLKRYGAGDILLVSPFSAFARQDKSNKGRLESIAADDYPYLLKAAGVTHFTTIEAHSNAAEEFADKHFGTQNCGFIAMEELFSAYAAKHLDPDLMVGAPDGADKPNDTGQKRAYNLAARIIQKQSSLEQTDSRLFKIKKEHTGIHQTKVLGFTGDVAGKKCAVVDDMVDGGSTLINASTTLRDNGATGVTCMLTHAILSGNALEKLITRKYSDGTPLIETLVMSDTCPDVTQKVAELAIQYPNIHDRVKIISVDQLVYSTTLTALKHMRNRTPMPYTL